MTTTEDRATEQITYPEGSLFATDMDIRPEQTLISVDRYTSTEWHQKEIEKLWLNVWQVACREDDCAETGDFFEYVVGPQSYLIVRGEDGTIRAFHNVCKHRANVIREGQGNAGRSLVCQFHLWSYNLDGSIKTITDRETFCELKDEDYGLIPVGADTWGGWVFIHPNPADAPPLHEFLSPMREQLEPYQLEHLVPVGLNITTSVSANWKVAVEAFIEVYHSMGVHPQLLPGFDDYNVGFQGLGDHNRMVVPFAVSAPRLGAVDTAEILQALFGFEEGEAEKQLGEGIELEGAKVVDPEDRRSNSTGALDDYFQSTDENVVDPMSLFEQYRDEKGDVVFPEGVTLRGILKDAARAGAAAKGMDFPDISDDQWVDDWHVLFFPNMVMNILTSSVLWMRYLPDWNDPNKSRWDIQVMEWIPDKEVAKQKRAKHVTIGEKEQSLGLILDQDIYQIPRIHRGLQSGALTHITLSKQEFRLIHFNETLEKYLER